MGRDIFQSLLYYYVRRVRAVLILARQLRLYYYTNSCKYSLLLDGGLVDAASVVKAAVDTSVVVEGAVVASVVDVVEATAW